jgi:hypothetical protein
MAEEKASASKTKPISDVQKPGKSAATATSKPILVTNRPIIKDPMVVEEKNEDGSDKEPKENLAAKGSSKTKIEPLETSPKPDGKQDEPEPAGEEDTEPEPKETEPIKDEEKSAPDKKTKTTPAEDEAVEAARKAEHDANLQKIADAKTYYLPINAVEKRKTKRFVILGVAVSVLLVLIWIDIALDAGLIHLDGVSPLTHFFSS